MTRKICVALGEETPEAMVEAAALVDSYADVIELRLDYLSSPDVAGLIKQIHKPVLCTVRAAWEGGLFKGEEEARVQLLCDSVDASASYIDIELNSPQASLKQLKRKTEQASTKLIVSLHDFQQTDSYDQLTQKVIAMQESGADIGKLITTAQSSEDNMTMLKLLQFAASRNFPLIGFCMGETGGVSRVITCDFGGYMTYCCKDKLTATAPGQIDAQSMVDIYSRF